MLRKMEPIFSTIESKSGIFAVVRPNMSKTEEIANFCSRADSLEQKKKEIRNMKSISCLFSVMEPLDNYIKEKKELLADMDRFLLECCGDGSNRELMEQILLLRKQL